jgi:DNA mismatch repair protein MutL
LAIRRLPDELINRIAAGEVVERPASVVKELVENAIDAGASRVAVTTAGGGKDLIRVEDNGAGMGHEDLVLSVEPHATSKLADDGLEDIRTLGFRGEALASIGSVAELTIATRQADAASGLKIALRYGDASAPVPEPMNRGTIVTVRDLFARTPARLKFLKTERAEAAAITDVVRRLAMANPRVQFVLDGADRSAINWPAQEGEGALAARVTQARRTRCRSRRCGMGWWSAGLRACRPTRVRTRSASSISSTGGRCGTRCCWGRCGRPMPTSPSATGSR